MPLTRLEISNVRLLSKVVLEPGKGLNVIVGPNASGKTSLLEAIHVLGTGRSFRTRQVSGLIRKGALRFQIYGQVRGEQGESRIGLEHDGNHRTIHLNGSAVETAATLAQTLPLLAITPDTHYAFLRSSAYRRGIMDWWLFHVEHDFYSHWLRYRRLLNQRNSALRSPLPPAARFAWDGELAATGERLNQWRKRFFELWAAEFAPLARELMDDRSVNLRYHAGWTEGSSLLEQLTSQREQDSARGFTHTGPQRADIGFVLDGNDARATASQGQTKMLITALRLAQVRLFTGISGRQCTVLADDIGAELDTQNRARVTNMLHNLRCQVFTTALDGYENPLPESLVFHVERGQLQERPASAPRDT